jgi:hypothetical protein
MLKHCIQDGAHAQHAAPGIVAPKNKLPWHLNLLKQCQLAGEAALHQSEHCSSRSISF